MNKEIIPAIMPKNFYDLKKKMEQVASVVKTIQIDIMDGKFVANRSWPLTREEDQQFLKIINQEEGFPFWEDVNIEADLMVSDPQTEAEKWVAAGATRIIIHYTSAPIEQVVSILNNLKDKGIEAGIAFTSKTDQSEMEGFVAEHLGSIDFLQHMGIQNIGFQGELFDDAVIDRIISLKQKFPELVISVDGGVNFETGEDLVDAGVDRLVSGSAIFESEAPAHTVKQFEEILKIA